MSLCSTSSAELSDMSSLSLYLCANPLGGWMVATAAEALAGSFNGVAGFELLLL